MAEWERALSTGAYRGSTLGRTLDEEGFVHCCFAAQVRSVADRFYRGHDGVVLLTIDPDILDAEVRVEAGADVAESFPHIYGEIPVRAVVSASKLQLAPDGRLALDRAGAPDVFAHGVFPDGPGA